MSGQKHGHSRLFEEVVVKSWWVLLFFFFCFFTYDQAAGRKKKERVALEAKLVSLQRQKEKSIERGADLKLQIASQNDPAWIEMTLMKELGLVPEGCTKTLFASPPSLEDAASRAKCDSADAVWGGNPSQTSTGSRSCASPNLRDKERGQSASKVHYNTP